MVAGVLESDMPKPDQYVMSHPAGRAVRANGLRRVGGAHDAQAQEIAARRCVFSCGGGEVRIQGVDGRCRETEIITPANRVDATSIV